MGNSDAYKKLREEEFEKEKKKRDLKAEWIFKEFKKPPGLAIDHMGEVHVLSDDDLRDLMRGYLQEYVWKGKISGEVFELTPVVDLSRYAWLPKYMYRRFLRSVCEVLGIIYRPELLEEMIFPPETEKARVEFAEKPFWAAPEERAKELAKRYEYVYDEIEALERFFKSVKEKEKLERRKEK